MKKAVFATLLLAAGCAAAYFIAFTPGGAVELSLPPGVSAHQTARILKQNGVVPSSILFRVAAKYSGTDRKLKPGSYRLKRNMPLPALLAQLEAGPNNGVRVVIPEGFSARQIAERLEADGVCKASEFMKLAEEQRLEGYLFPTTYIFEPNSPAGKVTARMQGEFKKHMQPEYDSTNPKPALTLHQLLTLASIVQREAVLDQEKPMIAAVYLNRMRIRMRLEADPTVQYALGHWKKGLTLSDLHNPSPYNTYVHYGLPPGPICNPGVESLKAAMHPARTDAIYFVADNTGGHVFSATLEDHIEAKHQYHRGLREIKRKLKEQQAQKKSG